MTIDPASQSIPALFNILTTAVAPRPICFASTVDAAGRVNLSPFSFFNVFGANPITFAFSASRRVRDGSTKHTLENILEVPEVVINIIDFPLVEQLSLASTEYAKGVNEFVKAGFTEVGSDLVRPPRVGEAPIAFECHVDQILDLGTGPGSGNLVIARAVRIHLADGVLTDGKLDAAKLDLVARMGGNEYLRASAEAKFTIPKPIHSLGIGIDQLPEAVRNSAVLTGNNLGRLGNLERLPTAEEIAATAERPEVQAAAQEGELALHLLAQKALLAGATEEALRVLLVGGR
ncbi:flavin reductase family protein [Neolewinella lacunae]|uniref:Flavin reductase family protein n=1 Tax=Neolewinella lacunae TaxID=1517758 RepID=A0A923T783_9BACT|nr:flavin reductase family protein [Neolewinella lacunae]MBC6993309.1 flavin reductase family protein [Neolewinella lacunae]MDN3636850.1 flavin reductase family protein [Neolewinella lacunae]